MNQMLSGALVIACAVAALFFLRFWRQTRERFFAIFSAAFWVLALNWLGLGLTATGDEARTYFYILRFISFLLILVAIWDNNRPRRR